MWLIANKECRRACVQREPICSCNHVTFNCLGDDDRAWWWWGGGAVTASPVLGTWPTKCPQHIETRKVHDHSDMTPTWCVCMVSSGGGLPGRHSQAVVCKMGVLQRRSHYERSNSWGTLKFLQEEMESRTAHCPQIASVVIFFMFQ